MATGRLVIVDTDVWSYLYARRGQIDPRVERWRDLLVGRAVAIATQTRAEVLSGARQSQLGDRAMSAVVAQLDRTPTVPVSEDVVQGYSTLSAAAKTNGHALWHKVHTGDRWIAATAIAVGAPLLSGDRVFREAPSLELVE